VILKKIKNYLLLTKNALFFDKHEKKFIKLNQCNALKNNLKKKNILIQVFMDYYYLAYYQTLINDPKYSSYNFIGLWPYFQRTQRKTNIILETLLILFNYFLYLFLYLKWKKLYQSIGVIKFEKLNSILLLKKKRILFKSRKDILNFKINSIYIGDLLYDTYLRFRAYPTIRLKDFFLNKLIYKCFQIILNLENIYKKYRFTIFFTSYSSYIMNGLPVRFFLKKKIKVFSGKNNSQYNKLLSKKDALHNENYKKFKLLSNKISKNDKLLKFSRLNLLQRFSKNKKRLDNLSYLHTDTYNIKKNSSEEIVKLKNIDGVLFMQDFFDSPHDWGKLAFDDYYIWTIFTLNIIKKYNLNIGIKPHPNCFYNSKDSTIFYERLKKKYNKLIWIDENFPNKLIFKKIKFGISANGTVLFELAYHNIKAVSCGDHPGKDFNFTINAKNKNEYRNILLNIHKIKKPFYSKKDLLIYNYLYYFYNNDAFENVARKINLKNINLSESSGLNLFFEKYEKFKNN
jgi:hypothetical protein